MFNLQKRTGYRLLILLAVMSLLLAGGGSDYSRIRISSNSILKSSFSKQLKRTYKYNASSAPALAQGVMYFGGEESFDLSQLSPRIFAVDIDTERERWHFKLPATSRVVDTPVIADGLLYVGTLNPHMAHVYALDMQTGQLKWQTFAKDNILSSVIVGDGVACFKSLDGYLYALDAKTGNSKWSFPVQKTLQPFQINTPFEGRPNEVMSVPAVVNGIVYVGTRSGLYALDSQTGKPMWKFATESTVESTPIVQEEKVYISSSNVSRDRGYIYGLNAQSGKLQWKYSVEGGGVKALAIADNVIYFGSFSPNLHAVDLVTGQEKWRFPTKEPTDGRVPFVHKGTVFFWSQEVFYALEPKTGKPYWQYKECHNCAKYPPSIEGPSLYNDILYYVLRNRIYAFDTRPHAIE
jgi:outer membrane protein assembly factor BamB